MGDMADMANERCEMDEMIRDEYLDGGMSAQDAYDHGLLDETGRFMFNIDDADVQIHTAADIGRELWMAEATLSGHAPTARRPVVGQSSAQRNVKPEHAHLNDAAIANLKNAVPTCNCCLNLMKPREGKFGKFYYCRCPNQPTVSDSYWQKTRIK